MQDCNPAPTPMCEKAKREALGKLLYLSIATRPDISYAVGVLCRFSENPGQEHWAALKRVLRYLSSRSVIQTLEEMLIIRDRQLGSSFRSAVEQCSGVTTV